MTKSGRVLSRKPVVFSIPIDFCIEFWNSTFSPVLEFTEGIFLIASARAFQWCKPRMRSCFRSKVIQVFLAANLTWTYYRLTEGVRRGSACNEPSGQPSTSEEHSAGAVITKFDERRTCQMTTSWLRQE